MAVWVSGVRCLLTYMVLPILGPVLGLTASAKMPIVLAAYFVSVLTSTRALERAVQSRRFRFIAVACSLTLMNVVSILRYV